MARYGLLIDYEFCTGCHSGEMACKMEHHLPIGKWGIQVKEVGPWKISDDKWQYAYLPVPTDMCNLCGERVEQGKEPACVHHCQAAVMKFGPVEELVKDMENKSHMVLFTPR
mgnify:CR=1 FL=1